MNHARIKYLATGFFKMPLIAICVLTACKQPEPRNILFIGNSLTYYHEMPEMLQQMFNEQQFQINVEKSTLPGASLSDHLSNEETLERINSRDWDFLILQEGTVRILIPEARMYRFERSVLGFDSIAKLIGAKVMLYQNYPISIYPEKYCYPSMLISNELENKMYCSDSLVNSTQEFRIITKSFEEVSKKIDSHVAPVGYYFEICKKQFPQLVLFESNVDTHPSRLGSFLIACVFFKKITSENVSGLSYSAGLNPSDVEKIKRLVDSEVMD